MALLAGRRRLRAIWHPDEIAAASARVVGGLDVATAPQLEQVLDEALRHARLVVLDVTELSFVDSCGLRVLFYAARRAHGAGARLVVAGAPRSSSGCWS